MSELKPLPVHGYSTQTPEIVALVNQNKVMEELALRQVDLLSFGPDARDFDQRWVAIARTHFQEGFMALNRAIFKPQRLHGPMNIDTVTLVDKQ